MPNRNILNDKFDLGFFPTPLHLLKKLTEKFDYNIYIKRDDQTGLATGGNKTRKLEYLIKDASDGGYDTVITAGAQQSNHCRQTAAACVIAGLECHLLVNNFKPEISQGNLLLDNLLGAKVHYSEDSKKSRKEDLQELKNSLEKKGKKVYLIPVGGSNFIGSLGYVSAMKEIAVQLNQQNIKNPYIFFATSSGGTQSGMMTGQSLFNTDAILMPVQIDKEKDYSLSLENEILEILEESEKQLDLSKSFIINDIPVIKGYNIAEYGTLTDKEKYAINLLAKTEGILLDPVYTGRAFFGMIDILKNKKIPTGSNVIFWHTGGTPALFSYAEGLQT